jgi:hypothetical protein
MSKMFASCSANAPATAATIPERSLPSTVTMARFFAALSFMAIFVPLAEQ